MYMEKISNEQDYINYTMSENKFVEEHSKSDNNSSKFSETTKLLMKREIQFHCMWALQNYSYDKLCYKCGKP